MKYIIAFVLLFLGTASAAPIPCSDQKFYQRCVNEAVPQLAEIVFEGADGGTYWTTLLTKIEVKCANGACQSIDSYEYLGGEVPDGAYLVEYDHYLAKGSDGRVYAFPWGEGPGFTIDEAGLMRVANVSLANVTYDLWCNPQAENECWYGEEQYPYTREQLLTIVPFADVEDTSGNGWYCEMESCYNDDDEVIGLNPFYSGYQ